MGAIFANSGRLDRIAIGLSSLCLAHCLATTVLIALVASAGGLLGAPIIHEIGLSVAMVIGAIALGRGVLDHGYWLPAAVGALGIAVMASALQLPHDSTEALVTMAGVAILALGHRLNSIASR